MSSHLTQHDMPSRSLPGKSVLHSSPKQKVCFSDTSKMIVFKLTGDYSSKFYTPEERLGLKIQVLTDVHRVRATIAARTEAKLSQDQCDEFIGIERLFDSMHFRRLKQMHSLIVLSSQGSCTPEELHRVSQESSRSSLSMAQWLASNAVVEVVPLAGSASSPCSAERNMGRLRVVNDTRKRKRKHSRSKNRCALEPRKGCS